MKGEMEVDVLSTAELDAAAARRARERKAAIVGLDVNQEAIFANNEMRGCGDHSPAVFHGGLEEG